MQVLSVPSGLRPSSVGDGSSGRLAAAKVVGGAGVLAYNWWVVVPFVPGLMPSVNGFFSDLEVSGRRHALLMSDADLVAGVLMAAALMLRGSKAQGDVRKEWKWLMAFAIGGAVGGRYPYACAEGLSAACRNLEWHLQLPIHHYVHVFAGITEFATLTTAAVIAMRRTRGHGTIESRIYSGLLKALAIGYPLGRTGRDHTDVGGSRGGTRHRSRRCGGRRTSSRRKGVGIGSRHPQPVAGRFAGPGCLIAGQIRCSGVCDPVFQRCPSGSA
jgi:hypothetical protein